MTGGANCRSFAPLRRDLARCAALLLRCAGKRACGDAYVTTRAVAAYLNRRARAIAVFFWYRRAACAPDMYTGRCM